MERERIANELLMPLWRGIRSDYKAKYSYSIWQQFEDNVRSAAYTSKLSHFLSKIVQRLGIEIREIDAVSVAEIIKCAADRDILHALRDETTLLVLMVRVANEERKKNANISV